MRLLACTGLAAAALAGGIAWYLAPLTPNVLQLQFAVTPRAFGDIIHYWSAEQLQRFRAHLPADCLLLLCYGLFGHLLATRSSLFAASRGFLRHWARWALPLAALCDAAENALHWWLTEVPRFATVWPYFCATACASAKWLLLLAYGITVAIVAINHHWPDD
ncbi:MAG: hypothetical protein F9K30_04540 [Dechloromonas sp.]|nr:MAG: hypothetical protein F9K30_04540 [Dechloromonas sp.]